jgi:hypothetical protein
VSIDDHLGLFKADWIRDPKRLKTLARESRYNDLFTAEIAAWCAEVHAHLRDLEAEVGVELILMGGNAASLRFDAVKQRGSRDNDYLTLASHADIQRLMDAFAERFAVLHPLFLPSVYEPKRPAEDLDLVTYVIPVALRLDHGRASNNTVKVEFHFETDLPPSETLSGSVGPTKQPMLARVPELPYQFVLKLMTLAQAPVGIDEDYRQDAVPRHLYDLDLLLAEFTRESQWRSMVSYCTARYARECSHWKAEVMSGEPSAGIQERLARWADCVDPASERWRTIRAVQQSQLRREVHLGQWGWCARCLRLATAAQCIELEDGWKTWQQALAAAAIVPAVKARPFKGALAELTDWDVKSLPLELHDFVWAALRAGDAPIDQRIANAHAVLSAVPPPK